jgi:hypothetical protein
MTLLMLMLFFLYIGVHTYARTKTVRISIELGNQRPEMEKGSMDQNLPSTRIMVYMLEDIDIRKAPAPFHYLLHFVRFTVWAFALVKLRHDEIAALCILTIMNTIYLMWMIHVRPYKRNLNNRLGIFVETCTLMTTLCMFPYIRAWPPRDIFIDFAKYQFTILWVMILGIPLIIIYDHLWKKFIMKEDYFHKPHRTIFESRPKIKKSKKLEVPEPIPEAEGEGEESEEEKDEEPPEEQKNKKEPPNEKENKEPPQEETKQLPKEKEKKQPSKEEEKKEPSATSSHYTTEGEESETSRSEASRGKLYLIWVYRERTEEKKERLCISREEGTRGE